MEEMEILGVRAELPGNAPIVMLQERGGQGRILSIFIGAPEATAIVLALDGVEPPRPMTHDLFHQVLDELGATPERVVVTELRDGTFYADLYVRLGNDVHVVSSRPSDAIALAVRCQTPVFVETDVLDAAAAVPETDDDDDEPLADEVVEAFRDFIDNVSPEDFES
ncbi:MAG: bifunctional nuclease family protein [Acidimicrobiia bacterium]|nr:bifunctional nuclease family protein [Acidimicrobiia bacterium]MDH5238301.1 bifunctional nuclease family protein [Acidimicrobiia bacterium]